MFDMFDSTAQEFFSSAFSTLEKAMSTPSDSTQILGRGVFMPMSHGDVRSADDIIADSYIEINQDEIFAKIKALDVLNERGLLITEVRDFKRAWLIAFNDADYTASINYHPWKDTYQDAPYNGENSIIFMLSKDYKEVYSCVIFLG